MNEAETMETTAETDVNPVGEGLDDGRKSKQTSLQDFQSAPPVSDDRHAEEDAAIKAHFDRIWQDAEAFSREVPGFDLAAELADDGFAALLSPARGLTLEQAYFVRHGRELLSAAERAAEARVSAALAASRRVPAPLGSAAAAPAVRWDAADAKTREALKARIRKGEKIYPGR